MTMVTELVTKMSVPASEPLGGVNQGSPGGIALSLIPMGPRSLSATYSQKKDPGKSWGEKLILKAPMVGPVKKNEADDEAA